MSVQFYTFSYNNPTREANMRRRFAEENLTLNFVNSVEISDPRLATAPPEVRRNWAIMFNHLDMLTEFLNSNADYGIFCEDDIFIRRNLKQILPEIAAASNRRDLEIVLLGYLLPYKPVDIQIRNAQFAEQGPNFTFHNFAEDTWGSQMYMLSRTAANRLINKYNVDYAKATLTNPSLTPFSPDWTLTKDGHRAAIYPMLAVEEGIVVTSHQGQIDFHRNCFQAQFDPAQFH